MTDNREALLQLAEQSVIEAQRAARVGARLSSEAGASHMADAICELSAAVSALLKIERERNAQ